MDITQAMHTASEDAPPSRVDVDRLIGSELRRRTYLWTSGFAGVAVGAVLVTTLGMTLVTPRSADPTAVGASPVTEAVPIACPAPTEGAAAQVSDLDDLVAGVPSEPAQAATQRLNETLGAALRQALPAGTQLVDVRNPQCPLQFSPTTHAPGYQTSVLLRDGAGVTVLGLEIVAMNKEMQRRQLCPNTDQSDGCEHDDLADGTHVAKQTSKSGGIIEHSFVMLRPDGTALVGFVSNAQRATLIEAPPTPFTGTPKPGPTTDQRPPLITATLRPEPVLSLQQAIEIVHNPGLTLYP